MKFTNLTLVVLAAILVTACASRQAKTEAAEKASQARKEAVIKNVEELSKEEPVPQGMIVGKPEEGSKFSKLKIGMTLNEVEKTIGSPTKQWTHPTGKASIPFYFGPDRWVIQYSYKGEGVLTLNSGGEQLLTKIEVNKSE